MKKKSIILLIIIALASYFYFFQDYFAFKNVEKTRTEEACVQYLNKFWDGHYVEDVSFIKTDIVRKIENVKEFIADYPNSKYLTRVKQIKNDLWSEEIVAYELKVKQKNGNPIAVDFFRKLLNYMKSNNVYDIGLKFKSNLELKNYEDYDERVKYIASYGANPPVANDNMLELKSNFSKGTTQTLEKIVKEGIEKSLDSVFSNGFVNIDTYNNKRELLITIDYTINNQEIEIDGSGYPNIWSYNLDEKFSKYLIGIDIDFKFTFTLPESTVNYSFEEHAEPGNSINNIENIEDGYTKMTQMSFALFANKISNNFGLDAGY